MRTNGLAQPLGSCAIRSAGAPRASRGAWWTAAVTLAIVCLASGVTAALVVVVGLTVDNPADRLRFVAHFTWRLAPILAIGLCWAAVTGFALGFVMRLAKRSPEANVGRVWMWLSVAGLVVIATANVVFSTRLLQFFEQEGGWSIRLRLTLTLLCIGLLVQVLRHAIVANTRAVRRRAVGVLLATAIVSTVAFLVVDGILVGVLVLGISRGTASVGS